MALSNKFKRQQVASLHRLQQHLLAFPKTNLPQKEALLALFYDLMHHLCVEVEEAHLVKLSRIVSKGEEGLKYSLLAAWLLTEPSFTKVKIFPDDLRRLFIDAQQWPQTFSLTDEERREEFIRLVLDALKLIPKGETELQAKDRLLMVSSIEQARLLAASQAAFEREEAIRRALAKKRARESADKYTRE